MNSICGQNLLIYIQQAFVMDLPIFAELFIFLNFVKRGENWNIFLKVSHLYKRINYDSKNILAPLPVCLLKQKHAPKNCWWHSNNKGLTSLIINVEYVIMLLAWLFSLYYTANVYGVPVWHRENLLLLWVKFVNVIHKPEKQWSIQSTENQCTMHSFKSRTRQQQQLCSGLRGFK